MAQMTSAERRYLAMRRYRLFAQRFEPLAIFQRAGIVDMLRARFHAKLTKR